MDDHNKSLKRKRLLSDPGEEHDTDTVGVCSPRRLAETTSSLCYGTVSCSLPHLHSQARVEVQSIDT